MINTHILKWNSSTKAFFSPDYERLHPEERDRIRELKELLNEQVKLLDHGLHLMKTMDRMHGTGLSDMLRSLGEILRDIKESLGMQSSSVRRSSSHLSVSSVRVSLCLIMVSLMRISLHPICVLSEDVFLLYLCPHWGCLPLISSEGKTSSHLIVSFHYNTCKHLVLSPLLYH